MSKRKKKLVPNISGWAEKTENGNDKALSNHILFSCSPKDDKKLSRWNSWINMENDIQFSRKLINLLDSTYYTQNKRK